MKTVLLVEDSPDDIFIMQRAWKKAEFKNPLRIVTDGQQAIDYLSNSGDFADREKNPTPCLILLDIKLPFLTGLQVIEWLRKYEPCCTIPAVFLTSSKADMDIRQAYKLGGNAYLVKPPTPENLGVMLQDLNRFWMEHNQFPPECLVSAEH
jgi:CheY-like chemotaxis protein